MQKGKEMTWLLIVWQTSFTQPIVKTYFNTERECLVFGANMEINYRYTNRPVEYKCFKQSN